MFHLYPDNISLNRNCGNFGVAIDTGHLQNGKMHMPGSSVVNTKCIHIDVRDPVFTEDGVFTVHITMQQVPEQN